MKICAGDILPETSSLHLKISRIPKGNDRMPTMPFEVLFALSFNPWTPKKPMEK